ncbi:Heat shock factor protein 2, partial [Globisporangium splendens]
MQTRAASSPSHSTTAMKSMSSSRKNLAIVTRVPKFLRCLYDILHTEDQSILSWSHDGSYFQIFSTKRLEDTVLPKYFKHSKFASFQRQLNNFGFRKWTKTQSSVCTFSHHLFVQRHPSELVELIIEQNEHTSSSGETTDEDIAPSPKKPVSNKRKRNESVDMTAADAFSYNKMLKATTTSFQDLLNFQVESWELMPIVNPLEWEEPQQQQTTAIRTNTSAIATAMKTEQGNETPTSASAVNEHTFNFTMEELDDILFTTSEPAPCSALTETFDGRFEAIDTSVGFATASSYLAVDQHDTTAMYLNDMFKSDVGFWLPC